MLRGKRQSSAAATQKAQQLLKDANLTATSSKHLLHRVRSKLQAPKSDVIIATVINYVDRVNAPSLDILQALLQILESQVDTARFKSTQHQLLLIATRRGHCNILEYLFNGKSCCDYEHGEALEAAVLYGRPSCVRTLLHKYPSPQNVERALLATDYVDLSQAKDLIKTLLQFALPPSVLEYLQLKMHAATGVDYDNETLSFLRKATNRETQRPSIVKEIESASLYAYFELQKQTRAISSVKRTSANSFRGSTPAVQITEIRRPLRNVFGDEVITGPENVVVKLLSRYLSKCAALHGGGGPWPLETIDLMLVKVPDGAEKLVEYSDCVHFAASWRQTAVFARLVYNRPLPLATLRSPHLQAEVVKDLEATVALVECLNQYHAHQENYLSVVEPLLIFACETCNFPTAIQICSQSTARLSVSPVIQHLKACLASERSIEQVADLLRVAQVAESDLDILWEHVLGSIDFPRQVIRTLLQAGYKSLVVSRTFLRYVCFDEELSNLVMMLDEWKTTKSISLRAKFDYITKMPVTAHKAGTTASDSLYHFTLASAMDIAIERQQVELCQMLLERDAPMVMAGKSLLEKAVHCDSGQVLDRSSVLKMILESERRRAGPQVVLDYALLQAVKYNNPQLVADLLDQGASTLPYNAECWRTVFDPEDDTTLRVLLGASQSARELSKNFMAIFASFTIDPKVWLSLCVRLRQAGYVNSKCFSWVLSVLCLCNKATVRSAEQLLELGASDRNELDQCLEQSWLHGNMSVFRILIKHGISPNAAEALFSMITKDVAKHMSTSCSANEAKAQNSQSVMAYEALGLLLQNEISKHTKDAALRKIAISLDVPASVRAPVLTTLLEQGARFSEDDGDALLHCLLMNNTFLNLQLNASRPPLKARQEALLFSLDCPRTMGNPAPSDRFHALAQLLYSLCSKTPMTLPDQSIIGISGIFLSADSDTPTTLIHHFYGWLRSRNLSGLSDLEHCWAIEQKLNAVFEELAESKTRQVHFVERITAVLAWTRPEPDCKMASARYFDSFWLPRGCLSRYLIESSKAGITPIVGALLEAGISPNVFDGSGKSALFWAASNNEPTVVSLLLDSGADRNDGSLHEATCQQNHGIMQLLLRAGHERRGISSLHNDTTPLMAFVNSDHKRSATVRFCDTTDILFSGQRITPEICTELKAAVEAALTNQYAFNLILSLMRWLRKSFDAYREIYEAPIARGPLRYSLLSLVDRWEYNCLSRAERNNLVLALQGVGFEETFYTVEGDQPGNAINVPEAIIQAEERRKRHAAFESKECCICGDKAETVDDIHAALLPTCATTHGWKSDIVCSDCLKQYLESRMFPHDDTSIKYKFPATKIPCWSPKCASTELPYHVLQQYTEPETFHRYDVALCQALLREGKSMVKCATQDCPGAHWYDEYNEQENLKIFWCELCFQNTCTECNDLYEKHDGRPCPAGEEARKCERIKEEEKLSEEALKLEKKCPKCKLMYQKYYGCDHIVCGKNVYDNKVDSEYHFPSFVWQDHAAKAEFGVTLLTYFVEGCRYEFCDICFGAWPDGHTRRCVHRM